jgi:hypothetical protein
MEIISPQQVNKMFELDFNDKEVDERALSYEDKTFLIIVGEGIHQRDDGHYEMPLPFKDNNAPFPNNKDIALR